MYKRFSESETRLHQLRQWVFDCYVTSSALQDNFEKTHSSSSSFMMGELDLLHELLKIRRARYELHIDWINGLLELHSELGDVLPAVIYLNMKRDGE